MEAKVNDRNERNQSIKKEINAILENWRGIYTKAHTTAVEEIKKYCHREIFVSHDDYGIECLCRVEGNAAFKSIYHEFSRPFEKAEFIRIQKDSFLQRIENDCKKISWYLKEVTTCDSVYPLLEDAQHQIANIERLLEEALEAAWEEHKRALKITPFYELKKGISIESFNYEPSDSTLGRFVCKSIGVKTYEYDMSGAVQALESAAEAIPGEADRIALKAVDNIITRKIVEPIKFALSVA